MRTKALALAGVLMLMSTLGACGDYLSGPDLTNDPNRPSNATTDQLYHGMQVSQFVWHTGDIPRVVSMWLQQMSGIGRQQENRGVYDVTEDDFDLEFLTVYTGGGLVDMRLIQQRTEAQGDRVYAGIAKVWEAQLIGMAASFWGDIPYSEAAGEIATPKLDEQVEVYAAVQALLDEAITDLRSGAGSGPGDLDLVYEGEPAKWIEAAYTLKARFYLHWVEAQNTAATQALAQTACGGNCVQNALQAATDGVSTTANDFRTFHSGNPGEQNIWFQFMTINRVGDIGAGQFLVELLRTRNDPRLAGYFSTVGGQYVGAAPGVPVAASQLSASRGAASFRQPLITYAENQLILAEANYRLGNEGAALTHLNNARQSAGLGQLGGLSGANLLREIAIEKYIALFQNPEAWNDYKRLCIPALTPAPGFTTLPGRLFYGSSERNANPNLGNLPLGEVTDRNDNDPSACSAP